MAFSISFSCLIIVKIFIFFLLLLPYGKPLSFNLNKFSPNEQKILFRGDAFSLGNVLQLTKTEVGGMSNQTTTTARSVGHISYNQPVRLWDIARNRKLTDFTTHFSFIVRAIGPTNYGDGISFFIIPFDSKKPLYTRKGYFALFDPRVNSNNNNTVAVEFDTYRNEWDPSDDHVGININSIVSVKNVTWKSSINYGNIADAWVSYNSTTKNLSVFLTYADNPVFGGNSSLSYIVDLRDFLPEWVRIGFSATSGGGSGTKQYTLVSWEFNSSFNAAESDKGNGKRIEILVAGALIIPGSIIVACLAFIWWWKQQKGETKEKLRLSTIDHDLERKAGGPRRYSYRDLVLATNNFADENKLGQGGFGAVYKGQLADSNMDVAVEKILNGSKQGEKEYTTEVKVISRLRHRNLVQLLGWCHDLGHQFLVVYEFVPNGSLDSHLFRKNYTLNWATRFKVCLGLANALHYLHNEWEQCVVHRDIKAANIMLDFEFNVKLGDFGLAKLMDHELAPPTTHLAGTLGYMAPEYIKTGRPSSKSDVFSFGVVALELATGRRSRDPRNYDMGLVEWVWNLYEQETLLSGVDDRVLQQTEFDEKQAQCVMFVGVWCTHPDHNFRPSIRQAIQVLQFEAGIPDLSAKMPVLTFSAPSLSKMSTLPSITNSLVEEGR